MSLSNRITNLEREVLPARDADYDLYAAYVTGKPFITEVADKTISLFESMNAEHVSIVIADCRALASDNPIIWQKAARRITQYFIYLLRASLEGTYLGPCVIPDIVADHVTDERFSISATSPGSFDCEDCGYPVGLAECFGYQPSEREYWKEMRCPVCGGAVASDAFREAHPSAAPSRFDGQEQREFRRRKLGFTKYKIPVSHIARLITIMWSDEGSDSPA